MKTIGPELRTFLPQCIS